jgi:serine/threonine protein kinase
MLRTPYLPGESDMDQVKTIFRALGTPTEDDWPVSTSCLMTNYLRSYLKGYTSLPDYVYVGQYPKTPFRDLFTAASTEAISLLAKLLAYEPRKRISAKEVIRYTALLFIISKHSTGIEPSIFLPTSKSYSPHQVAQIKTRGARGPGGCPFR